MFAWNSYATMLGSNAMVVVLTLALMIPLTSGDFDLSVASVMGLSSMLLAVLNVKMGMPIGGAIVLVLLAGAIVGAINAFFILYFGVHSLIVTLGTGLFHQRSHPVGVGFRHDCRRVHGRWSRRSS